MLKRARGYSAVSTACFCSLCFSSVRGFMLCVVRREQSCKCAFFVLAKIFVQLTCPITCVQDSKPGEVDLHGLYVKEAIVYADQSIAEARARGDKEIRLIVGSYSLFRKEQRLTFLRLFHREGHPLSESRREAQASHSGAYAEVGPR